MRGNKLIWLVLAILIIGASIVLGTGAALKNTNLLATGANLENHAIETATAAEPVYAISGTVASINGNEITIRQAALASGASQPADPAERTVVINANTTLAAIVPYSDKEMAAILKTYQAKVKADSAATPPAPFKEVPITPDDLRVTMNVSVSSSADVRSAPTITADKITFLAPPSAPPVISTSRVANGK